MKLSPSALKLIARRSATLWDHFYMPAKLRSDPVYEAVGRELAGSSLPVLDIGCGIGLLTHYLREGGHCVPMAGFDNDVRKISSAQAMVHKARYGDVSFKVGDARSGLPGHEGHVVLVDMLQFIRPAEQTGLLRDCAARVAPGGKLIIRNCLRDDSQRFRLTVMGDWLAKVTLWMKHAPVAYPSGAELRQALETAGLEVAIWPLWGSTPFNNHLIVARRPGAPPAAAPVSTPGPAVP